MGLSDLLFGKKSKTIDPDPIAGQIRKTQERGLSDLNAALDTPADSIVRTQAETAKKGILASARDARRNAQRTMAQRGLAGTSLGLSTARSIDQQAGDSVANVNAALPGQIRDQAIKDATLRTGAGGINTAGINFNKIEGSRSGGVLGIASALAPVAGSVAGAMYGGPSGAMAGQAMGQGISSILAPKSSNPYAANNYSMGNYNFY